MRSTKRNRNRSKSLTLTVSSVGFSLITFVATAQPGTLTSDLVSQILEENSNFKLQSFVESELQAYSLDQANSFLRQQSQKLLSDNWKHLEFVIGVDAGDISINATSVYGLNETKNWFIFNQTSLGTYDSRTTLNLGLGARHINDAETVISGLNAFYDYEVETGHQRMSVGGEFLTSMGQIRANQYKAISGDITYDGGTESALDGTDVKLTYELPYFYGSNVYYKYTHWYDSDFNDYQNEFGLTAEIVPDLTFKIAGNDSSFNGSSTVASVSYSIPLGNVSRPAKIKRDGKFSTGLKPIRDLLYIPVERENRIVKKTVKLGVTYSGF